MASEITTITVTAILGNFEGKFVSRAWINEPGKQLRDWRKSQGFKLRDVAHLTGLSISYLHDIESGRTLPSLETLRDLISLVESYKPPKD